MKILNTIDLIENLKDKEIKFNEITEEESISFLNERNYYIKVTAYKSNFFKHDGKYVGLDFLALKDLSTIDMYLKQWILKASLSVEHCLKVNLLYNMQQKKINEFSIVNDYLDEYPRILDEIKYRRETPYMKNLLSKYEHPNYPIWAFFEIIPFGEFVNFYKYYCDNFSYKEFHCDLLYHTRNIRNAAAHNNCIIHDLGNKTGFYKDCVVDSLTSILSQTKKRTIQDRSKNNSVQDFVSLLIVMDIVIKSSDLKNLYLNEIKELFDKRMVRDAYLYRSSPSLNQMYDFCKSIIDNLHNQ